jgi:cell division protein FtsB
MEIKFNKYFIIFFLLFAISILFGINSCKKNLESLKDYNSLLESYDNFKSEYDSLNVKNLTLNKTLKKLEKTNQSLAKEIRLLKAQGVKVKYVDVVRYKTKEVYVSYEDLPDYHLFKDESGLPLCLFENKDQYVFKVLPVEYTLNVVKSDSQTNYSLKGYSPYSQKEYDLNIDLNETETIKIDTYPKFNLNISAGISINYSNNLNLSPVVSFPFIHLNESLDVVSPELIFVQNSPALGISIADYKISNNLSYLQDTWVGVSYYKSLNENYIGVTLKSKF